jgi:hypothetical protein
VRVSCGPGAIFKDAEAAAGRVLVIHHGEFALAFELSEP